MNLNETGLFNNTGNEDDQKYVSCLAYLRGQFKELTTKMCFDGINDFLKENQKISRCISVFTKQGEEHANQLISTDDVQEMIEKIKKSIDTNYFNIPQSLQLEKYRVFDSKKEQQNMDTSFILNEKDQEKEYLRNFITVPTDDETKKQEMADFLEIEKLCMELLQERLDSIRENKENFLTQQNCKIIIYGPYQELVDIDNNKIFFNLGKNYFILRTLNQQTKILQIDNKYTEQARVQFEKQIVSFKAQKLSLGVIDSQIDQFNTFYKLYDIDSNMQTLQSISLQMTSEDKESKSQSVQIEIAFQKFYLIIEFPYLFCNAISECSNIYYFELVVPPKYYVRLSSATSKENMDNKMNPNVRVDNFYALHLQNELVRIEFTNNTVIAVDFGKKDFQIIQEFETLLKKKFSNIYKPNKLINQRPRIEMEEKIRNEFDVCWNKLLNDYQFNLSYSILTLVSHNKLSIFGMKRFLDDIDLKKRKGASEYILDKTIEYLYNKRVDINRFKVKDNFQDTFNTVSLQENQFRIQERNSSRDIKIVATRRVSITPSGLIYNLKELEMSNRVMRIFQAETDQFIRGIFQDDSLENAKHMRYVSRYFRKMLKSFTVLGRKYINFGWSASQLRSCSSWFFSESDNLKRSDVILRIGDFSKINPPAKKSARIGQCFSSSIPFRFKQKPIIEFIDDISTPKIIMEKDNQGNFQYFTQKQKVFTDGIGTISQDLAKEISDHLGAFFMSAIQVRYGGAKGVLCVNHKDKRKNVIQIRESMLKYQITDREDELTVDILERNKYRFGYLNRQVIILLRSLGINEEFFINAQNEYIKELNKSALKDANIFTLFNNDYSKDGTRLLPITHLLRQMQTSKIDMEKDIFCQGVIHTLKKRGFYILRKKSNIYLDKSARLMGVIDEYGVLEENEVFAYISQNGDKDFFQIEGDVIVVKNPCLHPGDIRKLKAVNLDTIQERLEKLGFVLPYNPFKKLRNILIFPQKGKEPVTSQIAGSDLDGDCYFICWDKRFIPENQREPFNYDEDESKHKQISADEYERQRKSNQKKEFSFFTNDPTREDIEDEKMLDFFIDFINNENLGKIDNAHLVHADKSDKFAEDPKCLQLATLHAQAVDYAKTGTSPSVPKHLAVKQYPDFMEKDDKPSYISSSILGKLYREVKTQYEKHCKHNLNGDKEQTFIDYSILFNPLHFQNYLLNQSENEQQMTYLESEIQYAIEANNQWNIEINNLKNFFGAQDEFEIYTGNFSKLIKVERKKKMSAEIVQQRIISTLVAVKNRFELMFFRNLDEDKDRFYDETNKRKLFSKKCKIRATIWYLICYLRTPQHIHEHASRCVDEGSLLHQFYQITSFKYISQELRGEVLLEIKMENDHMKEQELKRQIREQKNQEENKNGQMMQNQQNSHVHQEVNEEGYESDEYL